MLLVNYIRYYKQVAPDSSHILVILKNKTDLLHYIDHVVEQVKVIPFDKRKALSGIRSWKKVVKKHRPDLIHTHLFYACMLARLGTPRNIPVISTYHNQSYCKA